VAAEALRTCSAGDRGAAAWVLGVGKSGKVGARLAATLRSMALRCSSLDTNELFHGDLGAIGQGDVCFVLSQSGNTRESVAALAHLERKGAHVVLLVGGPGSAMEIEARRLNEIRADAVAQEVELAGTAP